MKKSILYISHIFFHLLYINSAVANNNIATDIVKKLMKVAEDWRNNIPQKDDITLIVIKIL